jgi:predicted DNA-binding transcriptional regulator YafY
MASAGKRVFELKAFETVALATIARKRLRITHHNRERGEKVRRIVSPQQLVHYRDNWYLDAWCHLRKGFRSFGVDAIEGVEMLNEPAKEVDAADLRRLTHASYGIFAGEPKAWAVLRFTPHRAQWIEAEIWHPQQLATFEADGSYLLKVPYSDDRELLGDILRFGADVQVLEPKELRAKVQRTLLDAAARYI